MRESGKGFSELATLIEMEFDWCETGVKINDVIMEFDGNMDRWEKECH